ncbi:hypothetical protein MNEG_3740 [Monoraphidium neglectum]|uniref:Peptidase M14 domain-containing protein n=1 Tax=Monoraphidium neglectum TaxID=145388 RepID=A0A0D2K0S4_9CHLO|nr:hypothetical protein MNEG_3740 [Monoraphidium neglectum]KIZ04213.1 hypothetical protein MNEG_3740 [Monoraphidium neglectum]|eukprot:XP_013903232.1 hypothetical protein MNEG_3740 [Monoraphidium neglectum]
MKTYKDSRCKLSLVVAWLVLLAAAGTAAAQKQAVDTGSRGRLSDQLLKTYLSNEQLAAWIDEFVDKCSSISRKFSIGKSVQGLDLWGIELSDKPGVEEAEPKFKYIANMHGDEPSGRMLLPMLAEWLCANNGKDARATRLLRDAHLFIIPTLNPDGFALHRRANSKNIDINRNFPDPIIYKGRDLSKPLDTAAPETIAIMNFTRNGHFTASANLHEGAIVGGAGGGLAFVCVWGGVNITC